jgi:hypothetical protein
MYMTNIEPENVLDSGQKLRRQYPHFRTVRIRHANLEKIKGRNIRYGESVDDILTRLLIQLEYYEGLGYPDATQQNGGSF